MTQVPVMLPKSVYKKLGQQKKYPASTYGSILIRNASLFEIELPAHNIIPKPTNPIYTTIQVTPPTKARLESLALKHKVSLMKLATSLLVYAVNDLRLAIKPSAKSHILKHL